MSFPALHEFELDAEVTHPRWKVYVACRRGLLNFTTPCPVKVWPLATRLRMRKQAVIDALAWLVARGYLVEHDRDHDHKTRLMTLAYERQAVERAAA